MGSIATIRSSFLAAIFAFGKLACRSRTLESVILGAGFGGLEATKALGRAPVEITLIDRQNYHCFQPLLYQVATAARPPILPGHFAIFCAGKKTRRRTYEARISIFAMGGRPVRTRPVRFELDHPQGPDREGPSQQDLLRPF